MRLLLVLNLLSILAFSKGQQYKLEAIREICKENQQTPIIVQSAYAMPEDRNLSFEVGANDFIAKPIWR